LLLGVPPDAGLRIRLLRFGLRARRRRGPACKLGALHANREDRRKASASLFATAGSLDDRRKSDCQRLAELLDLTPLRGRKSADYALWRSAVRAWVGDDPTERRRAGDWADLAYVSSRLKEVKRFGAARPVAYTDPPGMAPDWLPYMAGFVTAEGYFGIGSSEGRVRPRMRINARADDAPLLEQLAQRTTVGRVYSYPRGNHEASPVANWTVFSATDLRTLVGLLDEFPPRGKKGREYRIWRQAVAALDLPRGRVQARLRTLRSRLAAERAYAPRV
jgi:LAGLIDADG endonuclease